MFAVGEGAGAASGVRFGEALRRPVALGPEAVVLQAVPLLAVAAPVEDAGPQFPGLGPGLLRLGLGPSVAHHHLGGIARHARLFLWVGVADGHAGWGRRGAYG